MILYVDTKILKNKVNPSIQDSKKNLNNAKKILLNIKVPEGFTSEKKLKNNIPGRITNVDSNMGNLYKFVSSKILQFTNASKSIMNIDKTEVLNFGAKITASSVNEGLSLVKGIGNIAESLLETGAAVVAIGVTPIAGLSDLINYLTGKETSAVDELWRGTKGLIANEIVNSAFKDVYDNYKFGRWLDENAFKPYKSTGAIVNLTEGIGELIATAVLASFTMGAGAVANPAVATKIFTALRGVTGAGKAMQDFWKENNENSNGIDTIKGLGYATYIGGWEAIQAYVGGDTLKGINIFKSGILNSLARIGIDTGFNMADTPYRSLMDIVFKGKKWDEAWKSQGGWTSLLVSGGIGFLGSTFGEYFDYKKNKKLDEQIKAFMQNTDFNKRNLIEGILDDMPNGLDDLKKARTLYLKLNQSVKYADEWIAMKEDSNFQNKMVEMYYKHFDISNMPDDSVVCSNWSNIYYDLLNEAGIDPSKINIINQNSELGVHRFVKIELDNGQIILADATNNINGMTDLLNAKLGKKTGGFIITTQEEYDNLKNTCGSDFNTFKALQGKTIGIIDELDKMIGFDDTKYSKNIKMIEEYYSSTSSKEVRTEDKIEVLKYLLEGKDDYSALDTYLLAKDNAGYFFKTAYSDFITVGDKVITTIDLPKEKTLLYKINNSVIKMIKGDNYWDEFYRIVDSFE